MKLFEVVKENISTYDVAVAYGFKPNRSKLICCPFHSDKHPSMKVDERFYCFGVDPRVMRLILYLVFMV